MSSDAEETVGSQPGTSDTASPGGIRRRELLVGGGVIAGAALIARLESNSAIFQELLGGSGGKAPSFTALMLRPEDQLVFDLEFYNATLGEIKGVPHAVPSGSRSEFQMVAVFGPQSVAERPLTKDENLGSAPVPAQLSGISRLAFGIRGALPLDDDSILDWVTLKQQPTGTDTRSRGIAGPERKRMLLPAVARTTKERNALSSPPSPEAPTRAETAIEAPFRMLLSPALDGAGEQFWRNRKGPLENEGRTELWHTRLVNLYCLDGLCSPIRAGKNGDATPESEIRAVWTPGWKNNLPSEPFSPRAMTLTRQHRGEIVSLSSDHKKVDVRTGKARLLTVSALGASHELKFDFPDAKRQGLSVEHWSNRGTLGRDHYVKVVSVGYLFPFGHEVALISISERQIDRSGAGLGTAVIRKRQYLVIRQKTASFTSNDFPFRSVTIVDDITPLLNEPNQSKIGSLKGLAFWPKVGSRDYFFTLTATDVEGVRVEFQAPLIFVDNTIASGGTKDILDVSQAYNGDGRREVTLAGQSVAYAESIPGKARQTAFPTDLLELGSLVDTKSSPPWRPKMKSSLIASPAFAASQTTAARVAARGALSPDTRLRVKPADAYVKSGFKYAENAAQAYLTLAQKTALDYTKDAGAAATGALGAPNMDLAGLSRTMGPIGGNLENGTLPKLDPTTFLKGAKFLGIDFVEVLKETIDFPDPTKTNQYAAAAAKVPRTLTETIYEGGTGQLARKIPKEIRTEFVWEPELKTNGVFIAEVPGAGKASMLLRNVTVVPVSPQGPGKPSQDTTGEVKNFGLSLFGQPGSSSAFLLVYFNRFEFRSRNNQKPDVNVDIRDVVFAGPLEFVNDLRKLMSSLTGGSGLTTDITPTGVVATYAVDFPTITTGVITIADISFGAGIEVPFNGRPVTTRFNFCKPDRPFLLTYTIFGGGGYADIAINSKGVESLTVSLEFGAATAINLGVASGSVQVMAGIIIKVGDKIMELIGFVRLRGELDVLGIISVSLEFNLSLGYDGIKKEAWGRATLTVEVEVFCFSKSVSVTCEKRFSAAAAPIRARGEKRKALRGGPSGPTPISFAELFSETAWNTYRAAFATEAF